MPSIDPDREKLARYGINIADGQAPVAAALGGKTASTLFQGDRRFDIVVRLPEALRSDSDAIRRLPIALPVTAALGATAAAPSPAGSSTSPAGAAFVPLSELENIELAPGPNQISREDASAASWRPLLPHRY
ncbi:hypothetical protein C6V06_08350 [Burkholderia gladioli]|nr:hypothetical protein C6V06_08350 [Burkholderia gladioli]